MTHSNSNSNINLAPLGGGLAAPALLTLWSKQRRGILYNVLSNFVPGFGANSTHIIFHKSGRKEVFRSFFSAAKYLYHIKGKSFDKENLYSGLEEVSADFLVYHRKCKFDKRLPVKKVKKSKIMNPENNNIRENALKSIKKATAWKAKVTTYSILNEYNAIAFDGIVDIPTYKAECKGLAFNKKYQWLKAHCPGYLKWAKKYKEV